ncbi:MAG: PKD domain-containing protein, partial [bacterium]|nr:PKD domain-containing protein [bacterium]
SYLKQAEIWRANYNSSNCSETNKTGCSWSQIGSAYSAPANANSWSSSAVNTLSAGSYWYGLHVLDNAGNLGTESSPIKIIVNQPPVANFSCLPASCSIYTGEILTLNNNSTDPDNNLARSEWDILGWGSSPDLTCCSSGCNSSTTLCNYTVQSSILGKGIYSAKLTVRDSLNEAASLTKTFNIKQDAIADFDCSLDNSTWVACLNLGVKTGEKVYFLSRSSPSEGASITSWSWTFQDGNPAVANTSNPQTKFSSGGSKAVSLTIHDSAGRSASQTYNLNAQIPLPEWEEIPPF